MQGVTERARPSVPRYSNSSSNSSIGWIVRRSDMSISYAERLCSAISRYEGALSGYDDELAGNCKHER